jgi:hypothetical protein
MAQKLGKTLVGRFFGFVATLQIFSGLFSFAGPSAAAPYSMRAADLGGPVTTETIHKNIKLESSERSSFVQGFDQNGMYCARTAPTIEGTYTFPLIKEIVPLQEVFPVPSDPKRTIVKTWQPIPQPLDPLSITNNSPQNDKLTLNLFSVGDTSQPLIPETYHISPDDIQPSCDKLSQTSIMENRKLSALEKRQGVVATQSAQDRLAQLDRIINDATILQPNVVTASVAAPQTITSLSDTLSYQEKRAIVEQLTAEGAFSTAVTKIAKDGGGLASVTDHGTKNDKDTLAAAIAEKQQSKSSGGVFARARNAITAALTSRIGFTQNTPSPTAPAAKAPTASTARNTQSTTAAAAPSSSQRPVAQAAAQTSANAPVKAAAKTTLLSAQIRSSFCPVLNNDPVKCLQTAAKHADIDLTNKQAADIIARITKESGTAQFAGFAIGENGTVSARIQGQKGLFQSDATVSKTVQIEPTIPASTTTTAQPVAPKTEARNPAVVTPQVSQSTKPTEPKTTPAPTQASDNSADRTVTSLQSSSKTTKATLAVVARVDDQDFANVDDQYKKYNDVFTPLDKQTTR